MRLPHVKSLAVASFIVITSACSPTNSALTALPSGGAVTPGNAVTDSSVPKGYGILRFRIAVPGRTHDARPHRVMPAYVSSATRKVAVTVQGVNQTSPTTQKFKCTAVCSGKIVAPIGADAIAIQLEDKKSRVLARGTATVVVFATSGNTFDFTLDGIPASVALVPASPVLPVVPASTGYLNFDARDADGRIITPDGHYVDAKGNALVFTLKSSSAALRLSSKTVSAPSAPISFAYNGTLHVGTVTLTPKASRGIHTTVAFHPATLTLVPGIASRISPPMPVQILSATQVPRSSSAGFDPNVVYALGNAGGQTAALAFDVATGTYGIAVAEATGGLFQSPPVDLGAGAGYYGYVEFGNNLWNPEAVQVAATTAGGGSANPCASGTPVGRDVSGTLFCQTYLFPGYVYDSTHAVVAAFGQDRKIETINGLDYFVTVNTTQATPPGINVYAAGSTTPIAGATAVGADAADASLGYYGDSDGTVKTLGGVTVTTFSHEVRSVLGSGTSIYVAESDRSFGVFEPTGRFESASLPIGNVVEVVSGPSGTPMLVESDGTLDVMGV